MPLAGSRVPSPVGLAFVQTIDTLCRPGAQDKLVGVPESKQKVVSPITHGEMHALLEPLRSCLERVEKALKEQTCTPLLAQDLSCPCAPSQECFGNGLLAHPIRDQTPELTETQAKIKDEKQEPEDEGIKDPLANIKNDADGKANDELAARVEVDKVLALEGLADEVPFADRMAMRFQKYAQWWAGLSEPKRDTLSYKVVTSPIFENLCILVILCNSILVAYTADWEMRNLGKTEPVALDVLENACFIWFLLELFLRILAHRHYFFFNHDMYWNLFDLVLVAISMVDFVFSIVARVEGGSNVAFMRVLRLLKMAKIFRSLRSFRFFKSLALLLESFQRSVASLFWGLVSLTFVLYVFSLIFMQGCLDYMTSGDSDPVLVDQGKYYFGSFGKTFLSLYMGVTGGDDWVNLYNIMEAAGWLYGLLLAFFTFFFLFAIFNILTGALVEKAMMTSKPDRTDMIMRQRKKAKEERAQFLKLCTALDHDQNGKISLAEFKKWMTNEVMFCYMQSIGIEIHDVDLFFSTVACREGRNGSILDPGEVTIEHFVEGCMHMKGTATALDMQRQLFEMHILHHDLQNIDASFNERLQKLEQMISHYFRRR